MAPATLMLMRRGDDDQTKATAAAGSGAIGGREPRNPDFDDGRVVWDDSYSGLYQPVSYESQFDDQWRMFLERRIGFCQHTGVETGDEYIDDRIAELTGVRDYTLREKYGPLTAAVSRLSGRKRRQERRGVGGRLYLDPKFPIGFFREKSCLDVACGPGRWTRTLLALGARVKSIDVSESALRSVRRFNSDVERLSVFDLQRSDVIGAFDFAIAWGIIVHVHDPRLAFTNIAATVRPSGSIYLACYAPTYHASDTVRNSRFHYHQRLKTLDERIAYAYELTNGDLDNAINYFDMLNTFYNWTIEGETIVAWCQSLGLSEPIFLNSAEPNACQHHVLIHKPV